MQYDLKQALPILERTPMVLRTLLEGLDKPWTHSNEGEDTWSPYDVLGHLIHGEKTDWIPRINIIIGNTADKTFAPYDRFAQMNNDTHRPMTELLLEFEALRKENLEYINSLALTNEQLELTGVHPELGPVTLEMLLSAWVVHDLGHIVQVSRVMAKQYKDNVGPWPKYLSVLNQ